uniref:PAX-interacting protein 1 n=1 Tax=Sinocyclocheilus rhinocerous TaxID=307959 RepID=A0A673K8S0_9TELE
MLEDDLKVPEELFKDVKFYVVGDIDQKVVQLLKAGKGKEVSYNALATHIIAEDGDNPEVGESREVFDLPVVKPSWVILSVKCGDLLPVTGFSPESGQVFFGVTACLPHLSEDLNTLWAFITFYGGDCQLHFNKKCSHLVVPEPKGAKFECALRHSNIKIVTPEWILDSVKEKNRKDETLYHPRLTVYEAPEEEGSEYENERSSRSEGSYSDRRSPHSRRSSPTSSRGASPVGRRSRSPSSKHQRKSELMFDDSDDSSPEKEDRNLNWTPAEVPQPGPAKRRLQPGKETGLINLCANVPPVPGGFGPPDTRLVGAGGGVPIGVERSDVMGGWNPAARTLRNITNNTDKQQASQPSNVAHVRSLILNVIYIENANKTLLFCTQIIQANGGTMDSALSRCTHLLCESQASNTYVQALREGKRCVTAHWLNTVLKKKRMVPPHRTLHLPFSFPPGAKPCSQHIISVTGFVDSDRDDLKLMAYLAGARYTGYLCRSNTVLICKEPSGLKYEKAKEWRIPCVNAQWLCDILLGHFEALRQIQHSRYSQFNLPEPLAPNPHLVHNLLSAWRIPVKISPEALAVKELPTPTKKLPPESTPYVLFTGLEPLQAQQYIKKLYDLGGEVADSAQKCTHLVANKVTRTVKFLTAVSVVKHIVTPEWLEESWKSQKFVDEQSYMLRDAEAEVLFCFSLEESLKRAHAAPLFKGKYFYITPGICPSLGTMKVIVESAGGKVLFKQPTYRKIMEHKQNKNLPEIILITCENDSHLCREYFLKNLDVYTAELILTGVLTQTLDYESYPFKMHARFNTHIKSNHF